MAGRAPLSRERPTEPVSDLHALQEALSDMAEDPDLTVRLGRRAADMTAMFLAKAGPQDAANLKEWLTSRLNLVTAKGKARLKLSYANRRAYILQCALDRAEGRPPPAEPD
jgi:hypothetical protein